MKDSREIILEGERYITASEAAAVCGYTRIYVGQLCREEKIKGKKIGTDWVVSEKSILDYKKSILRTQEKMEPQIILTKQAIFHTTDEWDKEILGEQQKAPKFSLKQWSLGAASLSSVLIAALIFYNAGAIGRSIAGAVESVNVSAMKTADTISQNAFAIADATVNNIVFAKDGIISAVESVNVSAKKFANNVSNFGNSSLKLAQNGKNRVSETAFAVADEINNNVVFAKEKIFNLAYAASQSVLDFGSSGLGFAWNLELGARDFAQDAARATLGNIISVKKLTAEFFEVFTSPSSPTLLTKEGGLGGEVNVKAVLGNVFQSIKDRASLALALPEFSLPSLPFTLEDVKFSITDLRDRFINNVLGWRGYIASLGSDLKLAARDFFSVKPPEVAEAPSPTTPPSKGGENEGSKIITFGEATSTLPQNPLLTKEGKGEVRTVIEKIISGISQADLDQRLSSLNQVILAQVQLSLAALEKRLPSNQVQNPVVFLTTSIPGPYSSSPSQTGSGVSASFGDFSNGISTGGNLRASGNVTLGAEGKDVSVTSNVWNITSAGAASGLTSLTSTSINSTSLTTGTLTASSGNISSGLAASSTLQVTGDMTLYGNLAFFNQATTTIPASLMNALTFATSSASVPFFTFDTKNYRIGIGTTSPGATFSVSGDILASGGLNVSGASMNVNATTTLTEQLLVTKSPTVSHTFGTWAVGVANSAVTDSVVVINPASAAADTNLFGAAVGGAVRFLVDADGDVFANGLTTVGGTTLASTTASNFTVENQFTMGDAPNADSHIFNGRITHLATTTGAAYTMWNSTVSGDLLRLQDGDTSPTTRFVFSAAGQAAFGTTTHSGLSVLTIGATTTTAIPLTLKGVTSQSADLFRVLSSSDSSLFNVTGAGNVGIGTTSPAQLLSVQGNSYISGTSFFGGAITATSTLAISGAITSTASGANTFPYASTTALTVSGTASTTNFTASAMTSGSVLFAGAGGLLSQDNSNLFWDDTNNRLGIGTTSPWGLLSVNPNGIAGPAFVVGSSTKCVTGDTKLKRRRKRRRKNGKGEWEEEEYFEDTRIDEIKEGDEILTLDEKTGKLKVSRVNKLMDMGVKEIYTLTTATGKKIRTTANHPYLLAPEFPKERVAIFIDGANVEASLRHMSARIDYQELLSAFGGKEAVSRAGFYKVDFQHKGQGQFFTRLKKLGYRLITKPLKIIEQRHLADEHKGNFDVEIAVDAVERKNAFDTAVLFSGDSDFAYLAERLQQNGKRLLVIAPYRATGRELRKQADVFLSLADMPFVDFGATKKAPQRGHHNRLSPALPILAQAHPYVNGGVWTKVSEIKEGQMIATSGANGKPVFERIMSIEKTAAEQVYDIEVEGTHNFIGNDIVAHNTYLTVTNGGNVGIGTTNPGANLDVDVPSGQGTIRLSDTNVNVIKLSDASSGATTNGIISVYSGGTENIKLFASSNDSSWINAGNVGIGTTSPATRLSVQGNGLFSGNLTIAGLTATGTASFNADARTSGSSALWSFAGGADTGLTASTEATDAQFNLARTKTHANGTITLQRDALINAATHAFTNFASGNITDLATLGITGAPLAGTNATTTNAHTIYLGASALNASTTNSYGLTVNANTGATNNYAAAFLGGNVGIGTTSPWGLLSVNPNGITGPAFVVGSSTQCVTGDTRLRRRRRKSKGKSSNAKSSSKFKIQKLGEDEEFIYEEVAIVDVQSGDEIASLDETTGKIVWSKVRALMHMGRKPIIELETALGRKIRTTENHPYFVRERASEPIRAVAFIDYANIKSWLIDKKLRIDLDLLHRELKTSGVKEVRFYYGSDELGKNTSFFAALRRMGYAVITKPVQYFAVRLLDILQKSRNRRWLDALSQNIRETLLKESSQLDTKGIRLFEPKANFDVEIAADALEMANSFDAVLLFSGDGDFADLARRLSAKGKQVIVISGRKFMSGVLMGEADGFVFMEQLAKMIPGLVSSGEKAKPALRQVLKNSNSIVARPPSLSSGWVWTKVAKLKEGQEIAVLGKNGKPVWDKITSMRELPSEDVFDIEVEGTHNFIGNDIVAHNTYLTVTNGGNVGIGTTSPASLLSVQGNALFSGNLSLANLTATGTVNFTGTGATTTISGGLVAGNNAALVVNQAATANSLYITNAGNVGIGTAAPKTLLHIKEGAGTGLTPDSSTWLFIDSGTNSDITLGSPNGNLGRILFADPQNNAIGIISYNHALDAMTFTVNNATRLSIDAAGNVGIGTTSPATTLSVAGNTYLDSNLITYSSSTAANLTFSYQSSATSTLPQSVNAFSFATSTTATPILSINGLNGKVGIGRTAAVELDVIGHFRVSNAGATSIYIQNTASAQQWDIQNKVTTSNLAFLNQAGTEVLTILNTNGNVGIGTTSPQTKLEIVNTSSGATADQLFISNLDSATSTASRLTFRANDITNGTSTAAITSILQQNFNTGKGDLAFSTLRSGALTEAMRITNTGKVGIASTTPWRTFGVTGTVGFDGLTAGAGAGALCLSANKEVTYSDGAACTGSSQRFKHDINSLGAGALETVLSLRPVSFLYNDDIGVRGEQVGLIAEEVFSIDPRLVTLDASSTPTNVKYANLTAVLAKAIQELNAKVEALMGGASLSLDANGKLVVSEIETGKLTVTGPQGITIYDKKGQAGCLSVEDVATGAISVTAGACGTATNVQSSVFNTSTTTTDTIPPTITILGNNPATIEVGASYADLGVSVTDNVDQNLGYTASLDGGPELSQGAGLSLDTSTTTTHTILYKAVDQAGNVETAQRTVEVVE